MKIRIFVITALIAAALLSACTKVPESAADTDFSAEQISAGQGIQSLMDDAVISYHKDTGEPVSVSEHLAKHGLSVLKYAEIDLDGDSDPETVLWIAYETNEYYGFTVLHREEDTVYGYGFPYRGFYELKEDGTFCFSGGASDHGVGRISFSGDAYEVIPIAYCESDPETQEISFFIEGESVSKDKFDLFMGSHSNRPNAAWFEYQK